MKSNIKSLILVAFVASCLIIAPAFSTSWDDRTDRAPGHAFKALYSNNISDNNSSCNAFNACDNAGYPGPMMFAMRCRDDGRDMDGWDMGSGPMIREYSLMRCIQMNGSKTDESVPITTENHREGSGFAISDSQYHVLDLKLESTASFDLARINGLISDNKTIRQIKSDIRSEIDAMEAAGTHNGSIRLGEERYRLLNINLTTTQDENTTVDADVAGPITNSGDNDTTAVGHLTLTIGNHESSLIGKGQMTMNSGNYSGTYDVLINMESGKWQGIGLEKNWLHCPFIAMKGGDAGHRFEDVKVVRRDRMA